MAPPSLHADPSPMATTALHGRTPLNRIGDQMNLLPGPGSHQSAAGGGGRPLTPEGERQVDVTPDLGAEGDLDVDRVARDVAALAKQHELTVVPAVPASTGDHLLVALSGVNVSAESFVQAAAGAGCRLLYARRHAFTVD